MAKLIIVPTPIGNLQDITLRALEVLGRVPLVLAEDTRTAGNLLKHYDIKCPMWSYHKFNEHQQVATLIQKIEELGEVALVSDAGTPGVSDPGFLLVRACIEAGLEVECLPGATALVPALVASGLPADRFVFEGFLPQKKGRIKRLEQLKGETRTIIFYESPHRVEKTLLQIIEVLGENCEVCLARELSKLHEEYTRGRISEVIKTLENKPPRGEYVLLLSIK